MIDEETLKQIFYGPNFDEHPNGKVIRADQTHGPCCAWCRHGPWNEPFHGERRIEFFKVFMGRPFCHSCYPKIVAVAEADEKVKIMEMTK